VDPHHTYELITYEEQMKILASERSNNELDSSTVITYEGVSNIKDGIEKIFKESKGRIFPISFSIPECKIIDKVPKKEKLIAKLTERRSILGKTVEEYASNRSSDYIIYESFYKDEELKEKFFSMQEFEDMSYEELVEFILIYNSFMHDFMDLNIQKTVLMDFFNQYFLVLDYPTEFFGLPMVKLTDFQVRVIMYGKIFKSIFDHVENIPDNIRKDPEALFAYKDKSTARKDFESKHTPKGDVSASMVFGASKEDMEENNMKGTSLNKLMKEKKTLNMEELMKLHGEG
jgi:hypothetical protein